MRKFIKWLMKVLIAELMFIMVIITTSVIKGDIDIEYEIGKFQSSNGVYEQDELNSQYYQNSEKYNGQETKDKNPNKSKYFYNQLTKNAKIFYDQIYMNKENLKTGTYKIDFKNIFSKELNTDIGKEQIGDDFQSAIEAVIYDNPDIFYINPNKMYMNIETITKIYKVENNVFIDNGSKGKYLSDEFKTKDDVDLAEEKIEIEKEYILSRKTGDVYKDIKMVHDYLVDNVSYDTTLKEPHIYTIYGALVNKKAVCEGYAKSFKYLMDKLGIPCIIVTGESKNSKGNIEKHAWNYVQINQNWYAIDTTWDDPIIRGGRTNNKIKYKYFLKGEENFNQDHFPRNSFTENGKKFELPTLTKMDYRIR